MSSTKWKSENGFGESSDLFGVDFKRAAVSDSEGTAVSDSEGSAIVDADFKRAALSDESDAKSSQSAARGCGKRRTLPIKTKLGYIKMLFPQFPTSAKQSMRLHVFRDRYGVDGKIVKRWRSTALRERWQAMPPSWQERHEPDNTMRRLLGIPLKGASIEHAYPPEVVEQMAAEFKSRLAQVQSAAQAVRRMAAKSIRPKAVRDTMVGFIRRRNSKISARREAIMRQNDDRAQRGLAPRELPDFIKRQPRERFVNWFSQLVGLTKRKNVGERLERCYNDPTMVKIREGLQMQVRDLNTTWSLVLNVDEMWRALFRHSEKRVIATTEQSERRAAVPVVVVRVQEEERSVSNPDEPGVPQRCASYRAHASSGPEEWWGPWHGRRAAAEDDAACLETFRKAGARNSDYDTWHNQINKRHGSAGVKRKGGAINSGRRNKAVKFREEGPYNARDASTCITQIFGDGHLGPTLMLLPKNHIGGKSARETSSTT